MLPHEITPQTGRAAGRDRKAVEGRWENEGGATPADRSDQPLQALPPIDVPAPTQAAAVELDELQDEIMTAGSSDGRPPTHKQRSIEWRWLGIGAIVVVVVAVVLVAIKGVGVGAIVLGILLGGLLLAAGSPVWIAGLMRGREERAARRVARHELE